MIGIVHGKGEMFRRVEVGDLCSLLKALGNDDPGIGERGQAMSARGGVAAACSTPAATASAKAVERP